MGNYITLNSIMHTADDAFSVTVITVRRGKILGQVGQPIFLQSVHLPLGSSELPIQCEPRTSSPGEGVK